MMIFGSKGKRIFIGTTEIAGYYRSLSQGLDSLGVNYKFVQLSPNTSGFGSLSKLPYLIRLPYILAKLRLKLSIEPGLYTVHKTKKSLLSLFRFIFYVFEWLLRVFIVLPWAMINFDVFCFGCRSNIVGIKSGYWDIALLKFFKKRIIYVYHGSDSRPPYINGSILHNLLRKHSNWQSLLAKMTKKTKKAVNVLDKLADEVIDNPYSGHFHDRPFINWFVIGSSYQEPPDYLLSSEKSNVKTDKRLRILHAPTHRIAKGTPIIEECINNLQLKGLPLDLIMLNGRPHKEVIEEIKRCDFVIDEIYSDALMAGFAAEASFYGKPVIVCGYIEDEEIKHKIPTYYCKPQDLESAILKFIREPEFRSELGSKAQRFIKEEWSCINIARAFVKIFENQIPDDWYFYPNNISYLHGFGMSEKVLKDCIFSLVSNQGIKVLQLEDKPNLRDSFLNFAGYHQ